MTLNKENLKIKNHFFKNLIYLFIFQPFFIHIQLFAQESFKLNEIEMDRTTNLDKEDNIDFPTNPFEIVDIIRKANSMNDATKPSDAIDEAIKSFDMITEEK